MSGSFRSQKTAMNAVVSALNLLKERGGSTSADIYFVLDNIHGRVKRNEVQKVLRSAVSKGILKMQNQRYKINTKSIPVKNRVNRRKSVGHRTAMTGRSFGNYKSERKFDCKSQRVKSRESCVSSDYDEVPVQNFECRCLKAKSTRSCAARTKRSYSFKEIQNLLPCDCNTSSDMSYYSARSDMSYSSAEPQPKRKRTNKQNKIKRPQPKKNIKLELDSEKAEETKGKSEEQNENTTNENQKTEKGSESNAVEKSADAKESQETKKLEESPDSKANNKPCSSQQTNESNAETDLMGPPKSSSPRRSRRASTAAKVKSEKSSVGALDQHRHRYQTRSKTKQDNEKS